MIPIASRGQEQMKSDTRAWLDGLREFTAAHRLTKPLAGPGEPAEAAAERGILAGHLVAWLEDLTEVLAARQASAADVDAEPALVLTTSAVGIEAATELCSGGHPLATGLQPAIAAVTELEYRLWCMRSPDEEHRLHVNHWNWIKTRVPPQRAHEFSRHPLAPHERYWLHRTGTAGAGRADRRDCHLWKWDGRHAALLEPFIREGLVARFAAGGGGDD